MIAVAAPARAARIACAGVTHRYGSRLALAPLSFELAAPGLVAVTGANGAGKSTLLMVLAGLLRPTGGAAEIEVDGARLAGRRRRSAVGLSTPELAFYEEFTARENLAFAARTRGLPDAPAAVAKALASVGLDTRAGDRVGEFSSGMKQRLRLGFAILHEPALLLLDEPGTHLDDAGRAVVERLLREYSAHALVVLATNEPREIQLAQQRIELRGSGLGHPS